MSVAFSSFSPHFLTEMQLFYAKVHTMQYKRLEGQVFANRFIRSLLNAAVHAEKIRNNDPTNSVI